MEGHGLDTPSAKPPGKEAKSRPRAETRRESFEFAPSQGGARPGRPGRSVGRSATLARFVGAIKKLPREMSSQGEGRAGHRGRGQELRHGGGAGGRRGGLADDQSTPGRHRDRGGMPSGGHRARELGVGAVGSCAGLVLARLACVASPARASGSFAMVMRPRRITSAGRGCLETFLRVALGLRNIFG